MREPGERDAHGYDVHARDTPPDDRVDASRALTALPLDHILGTVATVRVLRELSSGGEVTVSIENDEVKLKVKGRSQAGGDAGRQVSNETG